METIGSKMKILNLPLKGKWYKMIESGEKTEEYREKKPYWLKRLCIRAICRCEICDGPEKACFVPRYDAIRFRYGYTKRTMLFKLDNITIGKGRPQWGAPDCDVFVLKLGNRIN